MDDNQNINTNTIPEEAPQEKKRFIPKKYLIILVVLFVILNIFLFSWTKISPKTTKIAETTPTPIAETNPVLAEVGTQKIYKNDVQALAEKQYIAEKINKEALDSTLNLLIERKILDNEVQKLNIAVSQEEVLQSLPSTATASSMTQNVLELKKYLLLKNKIIQKVLESRTAYIIGFWIPPINTQRVLTTEQKNTIANQRKTGNLALSEIEKRLKKQEEPYSVAKFIYDNYPVLKPILAFNGYIFEKTDKNFLLQPEVYVVKSLSNTPIFDALKTMQVNEVKKVMDNDGAGGSVIYLKSSNSGELLDYKSWLEKKKLELVKMQ